MSMAGVRHSEAQSTLHSHTTTPYHEDGFLMTPRVLRRHASDSVYPLPRRLY